MQELNARLQHIGEKYTPLQQALMVTGFGAIALLISLIIIPMRDVSLLITFIGIAMLVVVVILQVVTGLLVRVLG